MDFAGLSERRRPATISGVGYPPPASGAHDFLLITHVRRFEARQLRRNDNVTSEPFSHQSKETTNTVYWIWIVQGYRRTGRSLNIGGRDFEVLDNSPGAFGTIAHHEGVDAVFTSELSGGGIQNLGGNIHALRVPHNGSVEIETRIAATTVAPGGGCLTVFLAWFRGLFS
jgi:hypothetical protein